MLDVILNSKLSAAADAGIAVELACTQAPDKLPLTDAELCSLIMNLPDNAVEAASATGVERCGNLSNTEYGEDYYKAKVLIPLRQPLK